MTEEIAPSASQPYFFTASACKLVLMSIFTAGAYELYWFYKNWVLIKQRTHESVSPFWRALGGSFCAYSCFIRIKAAAVDNNIPSPLSMLLLAAGYFVLSVADSFIDNAYLNWLFLLSPSVFVLLPVNSLALAVNRRRDAGFRNNDRFTVANRIWIVLGGIYLLFGIISNLADLPAVRCAIIRSNTAFALPFQIMRGLDPEATDADQACLSAR